MNRRRKAAAAVAHKLATVLRTPRHGLRVLMYHSVAPSLDQDAYGLNTTPQLFRRQMEHLAASEHIRVTTVDEIDPSVPPPQARQDVVITFDDGFSGIEQYVRPIMEEFDLPFVVFATWAYLEEPGDRYLSKAALVDLASHPLASVGSHGLSHARLNEIDVDSVRREVRESRDRLRELLGRDVTSFAYPHGGVDAIAKSQVVRAGYTRAFSSRRGLNRPRADLYDLARTEITADDGVRRFEEKIRGAWDWLGAIDRVRRLRLT